MSNRKHPKKVQHPDAALLKCCANLEAAHAALGVLQDQARDDPSTVTPERDERFEALLDGWHEAFDRGAELPARTPEGIRAKARMLRCDREVHGDDKHDALGRFIDSFLADLLPPDTDPQEPPSVGGLVQEGRHIADRIAATIAPLQHTRRGAAYRLIAREMTRQLVAADSRAGYSMWAGVIGGIAEKIGRPGAGTVQRGEAKAP